jgi:hypothetical protein
MRTFIERIDARSNTDVRSALERWKTMRRNGWTLSALHRYKPEPTLIAFGSASDDVAPWSFFESLAVSGEQLSLFASDSPER